MIVGQGPTDNVQVAVSNDGGQTWQLAPAPPGPSGWSSEALDCVSKSDCLVVGGPYQPSSPVVLRTTDWGVHWTALGGLPAPHDYLLNGISCPSANDCVAVGGNPINHTAEVVRTTNAGQTWSASTTGFLSQIPPMFTVSCPDSQNCSAGGQVLDGGTVFLRSTDGGKTWAGEQLARDDGWVDSIACPTASNCWLVGTATVLALAGTANGGSDWLSYLDSQREVTAGTVACTTVDRCWATQQGRLWATTDDGDLEQAVGVVLAPTSLSVPVVNAGPGSVNVLVSDTWGPATLELTSAAGKLVAKISVSPGFNQEGVTLSAGTYEVEVPGSSLAPASFVIGGRIVA